MAQGGANIFFCIFALQYVLVLIANDYFNLITISMKKFYIAVLTLTASFCTPYAIGRTADVKRIEIEKESSTTYLSCDPVGENGLILTTREKENQKSAEKNYEILTFIKYDTLLNKVQSVNAACLEDGKIIQSAAGDNIYRIALKKNGEYEILLLNGENMQTKTFSGETAKKMNIAYHRLIGDYLYIVGEQKGNTLVYCIDIKTGNRNMIEIPVNKKKRPVIMSFEMNETYNEAYLFTKEKEEKGYVIKLYVLSKGSLTNSYTFAPDEEGKYPATAFASKMDDGSYIISGTYSDKDSKHTHQSIGIFLKKIENGNTVFSTYTNYLDLKNFTSYMSERKQKRVEKKKGKKAEEGEEYTIDYNMLPYEVIEDNGKYLLVGEAFYATYTIEFYQVMVTVGKAGMVPQTHARSRFDGFAYTHYFVLEFDKSGTIGWSNAAPVEVAKTWTLQRHLTISKDSKSLDIIYPSFDKMNHISYGNNGEELNKEEISYVGEEKELKKYYDLETQYWYGSKFVSAGLLKVKDDEGKRRIYSINKISFGKK